MDTDYLLDDQILGEFADALEEYAPEVRARLRGGLSEDEIRTKCAAIGLAPSRDAVAWWSFWEGTRNEGSWETRGEYKAFAKHAHDEILPGFMTGPLDAWLRVTTWWRDFAEQEAPSLAPLGIGVDDLWRRTWLAMFTNGGGGHTMLDCSAPDEPSVLLDCFRENFSGPNWGMPIRAIGPWLANGTEWMRLGTCRYEAESRTWRPHEAAHAYWPLFDPDASYDAWR